MSPEARDALAALYRAAKVCLALSALIGLLTILRGPVQAMTWWLVAAEARAQSRALDDPILGDVAQLKTDVREVKSDVNSTKLETARNAAMLEMLVRDRGMRVPPPVDGGP